MRTYEVADLFCGAGGTSTGAVRALEALGFRVRLTAVNHWDVAVATHSLNHPDARHLCASIDSLNPAKLYRGRQLDLLWASPECTHHSRARGGVPMNDQSRATAWAVVRWAEALRPSVVLVENVPEFCDWGPLTRTGAPRPIAARKGETFRAWLNAMESLGYRYDFTVLNAADYGDPTTRRRLFVQFCRGRRPVWPKPTHGREGGDLFGDRKPWRGVKEVIDWSIPGRSVFRRKKPLAANTLARIKAGLLKYGLRPMVMGQQSCAAARPVDAPCPTIATAGAVRLLEPYVIDFRGTDGPHRIFSVDAPLSTITAGGLVHGLCEPFVVTLRGTTASAIESSVASVDAPIRTISAGGGHHMLCEPFVMSYYGNGGVSAIDEPLPTVTCKDRFGLVLPVLRDKDGREYLVDVLMRMFQPHELAGAMGFPHLYQFAGSKTDTVRQIGNAVPCGLAFALVASAVSRDTDAARRLAYAS